MASLRRACLGLLLLSVSCGDPLADDHYRGVPRLTFHGRSGGESGQGNGPPGVEGVPTNARLGIFWDPHDIHTSVTVDSLVEQPSNSIGVVLPGDIVWSLYDLPEEQDFTASSSGARYALGFSFVYEDSNGNRHHDSGEPFVADAPQLGVLYAPEALSAEDSPTRIAVPAGFHIVSIPFLCGPHPPPPLDPRDCGVPLGSACQTDHDCGTGGVCLLKQTFPWPGGYCAIPEPPPNGCRPAGGVVFHDKDNPQNAWWVKGCQSNADCARSDVPNAVQGPAPVDGASPWQCDFTFGACLPTTTLQLFMEQATLRPMCAMPPPGAGGGAPQ